MERKISRNGLELVKYGAIRLKGNFSALFMGTFAMVTPLVLMILLPSIVAMLTSTLWIASIGIVLFAIFVGPLQYGYIKYFNEVIEGKQPTIFRVYSQIRFNVVTIRTMYISMLLLIMYIFGGVLWIVPAGLAISFYSMSLFFYERFANERLTKAMHECAKHMVGNRLAMFSYKLIFYLVYFMLFIVAGFCLGLVYILAIDSMFVSWIVAVCSTVIFIFLYTMVTVYFHSCNQIFFEDTLMVAEKKRNKRNATINMTEKNENHVEVKEITEPKTEDKKEKEVVNLEKTSKVEEKKEDNKSNKEPVSKAKKSTKSTTKTSTKPKAKTSTKKVNK